MTVVEPGGARGDSPDAVLERDLADLRAALEGHSFPAQKDDLMAACLGRGEPVRLCSRLSTLPHATVYASVDDVVGAVAAHAR